MIWMRARWTTGVVLLAALLGAGWMTTRLSSHAWEEIRAREPALRLAEVGNAAGEGLSLGLLGGFRAIVADLLWLRMNQAWEQQDLAKTQSLIHLVTAIDPRPLYFWFNGARIIAFDVPVWRNGAAARDRGSISEGLKKRHDVEQAQMALRLLERHSASLESNPWIEIEKGKIHLWRLGDREMAAEYFRRAALMPGAPYFAGRMYAEILREMGRNREAYDWLVSLHGVLPRNVPDAMADVVLERIRALEQTLGIAEGESYQPVANDA